MDQNDNLFVNPPDKQSANQPANLEPHEHKHEHGQCSCGKAAPANGATLRALKVHQYLRKVNRISQRSNLRFIEGVQVVDQDRLYGPMGYPNTAAYVLDCFQRQETWTYEALRVVEALGDCPKLRKAYEDGTICWSVLRELTRVASGETEADWLDFSHKKPFKAVRAEVRDALGKKRKTPRKDGYGLPAMPMQLVFEVTAQEYEAVMTALEAIEGELSMGVDGKKVGIKAALLHMTKVFRETAPGALPEGRKEHGRPLFTVFLHTCKVCKKTGVMTKDGLVEASPETVERVKGDAEVVEVSPEEEMVSEAVKEGEPEIDRPTPRSMLRKALARDGMRCSNPACRAVLGPHCHHLKFRAKGGRTQLWNLAVVCCRCHTLIHAGYLVVKGNMMDGLEWETRVDAMEAAGRRLELEPECAEGESVPPPEAAAGAPGSARVKTEPPAGADTTDPAARSPGSARVKTPELSPAEPSLDLDPYVDCLEGLGWKAKQARKRVEVAVARLRQAKEPLTDEAILRAAFAGRSPHV